MQVKVHSWQLEQKWFSGCTEAGLELSVARVTLIGASRDELWATSWLFMAAVKTEI